MSAVAKLLIIALCAQAPPEPRTAPEQEGADERAKLPERIETLVQGMVEPNGTPALSIAIGREGEVWFAKGWGYAEAKEGVPAEDDTLYPLGSLTRQFTAVGILQLVEQEKLALDAPIGKLLPELPAAMHAVTVQQLLSNTGGIPSYAELVQRTVKSVKPIEANLKREPPKPKPPVEKPPQPKDDPPKPKDDPPKDDPPQQLAQDDKPAPKPAKPPTPAPADKEPQTAPKEPVAEPVFDSRVFFALFKDAPLDFEPGHGFEADSAGYLLLSLVLARVSGESYEQYVKAHILQPLELQATRFCPPREQRPRNFAVECEPVGDDELAQALARPSHATSELCSTAAELLVWQRALEERALLSEESSRMMETAVELPGGSSTGNGFALAVGEIDALPRHAHVGGAAPHRALLAHYPTAKLTIAILANCETVPVEDLEKQIARLVLGVPADVIVDLPLEPDEVARYAGNYQVATTMVRIYEKNGKLVYESAGQPAFELLNQGRDVFVSATDKNVRITFQVAAGAESAESFTLMRGGFESTGKRMG